MTVRDVKRINGLRTVSLINEILMELLVAVINGKKNLNEQK